MAAQTNKPIMLHTDLQLYKSVPSRNNPLPPSPRSAPALLLERQNQALREEATILQAQIDHLRRLLEYYRDIVTKTKALVTDSLIGIKRVQDATFVMKRGKKRIQHEWDEYLDKYGAIDGENLNDF